MDVDFLIVVQVAEFYIFCRVHGAPEATTGGLGACVCRHYLRMSTISMR
jgi:hypothetical protein